MLVSLSKTNSLSGFFRLMVKSSPFNFSGPRNGHRFFVVHGSCIQRYPILSILLMVYLTRSFPRTKKSSDFQKFNQASWLGTARAQNSSKPLHHLGSLPRHISISQMHLHALVWSSVQRHRPPQHEHHICRKNRLNPKRPGDALGRKARPALSEHYNHQVIL
jgi:hypothetical protein